MPDFILYTDGGGNNDTDLGAACIAEDTRTGLRYHVAAYLGKGTNNEAEVTSIVLGMSVVRVLSKQYPNLLLSGKPTTVEWYSDSEYSLFGITKYIKKWVKNGWRTANHKSVKNQGLWKTLLELKGGLQGGYGLTPKHVKGHSGHLENELCDSAATWVRRHAISNFNKKLLCKQEIKYKDMTNTWLIVNAMDWLKEMRYNEPLKENMEWFIKILGGKHG